MHRRRAIDTYLATGLRPGAEARLRRHLATCDACRAYYDEQLVLLRALAGEPDQPTPDELRRMEQRALAAAGCRPAPEAPWLGLDALLLDRRWLVAAACAAVLLVVSIGVRLLRDAPVVGRLTTGRNVTVAGEPAQKGTLVRQGDRIVAAEQGLADLALERGGSLRLFPGAAVVPDKDGAELEHGRLWCIIRKAGGGYEVRTEEAVARVVGTSFLVERRAEETEVRVVEGAVEVEDRGGQDRVRVAARQRTRVKRGAPPEKPTSYSPGRDQHDWERFFAELLEQIKKSVGRGLDALQKALENQPRRK